VSAGDDYDPNTAVSHRKELLGAVDFSVWPERLQRFMAAQPGIPGDVQISDLKLPTAGGSSGTLMFSASFDAASGRVERDFVLRHATPSGLFHSYNLPGQYAILKGLQGRGLPIPGVAGIDADGSILGVVGYVMERVEGVVPPPSYFKVGAMVDASPASRRRMLLDAIATLAKLHAIDWRELGIEFLLKRGNGRTAIERDLDWYWSALCWACPREVERHEPLRQWFLRHQPKEDYLCLNHGDAQIGNNLFRDDRVAALLDWELAAIGNPANDVAWQGFTHSFLGLGCEPLAGFLKEEEWKGEYERISGRELTHWDFYQAFSIFKVHVSIELVFRDATPELATAKTQALGYTWQRTVDQQAKYRG
jgi:aminoglycoside phosphotransferase (APT) family kinase protein